MNLLTNRVWACPRCKEPFVRFNIHGVDMEIESLTDLVFEVTNVNNEWLVELAPISLWALSDPHIDIEAQTVLALEYMQDSEYEVTECCGNAFDVERDLPTQLTADPLERAMIQPDDPMPGTTEFALISPDEPIPPRDDTFVDPDALTAGERHLMESKDLMEKSENDDEDLGIRFEAALSTMDRYMASKDPYVNSMGMVNDPVELELRVHPEWGTRLMAFLEDFNPESPLGPEAIWLMDNQFSLRTGG